MSDVEVLGAENLARVARALKATGNKELRRELQRSIQRSTKPLKAAVRDAAKRELPRDGGLNLRVARSKITTKTSTGRDPSVRIVAKGMRDVDRGVVRHPVFGDRRTWVNQRVPAGVFSRTLEGEAPAVRRELNRTVRDVARELEGKAGR